MKKFVAKEMARQYFNWNAVRNNFFSKNNDWDDQNWNIRSIPRQGTTGHIEATDGRVLGLSNGQRVSGTKVELQVRNDADTGQLWGRGTATDEGYFTLKNQHANQFLTAGRGTDTTIAELINYRVYESKLIKDYRWVNFRFLAGENLFKHWKMLMQHFTEVVNKPRGQKRLW